MKHDRQNVTMGILEHIIVWLLGIIVISITILAISVIPLKKTQMEMSGSVQDRVSVIVDGKFVYSTYVGVNNEVMIFPGSNVFYESKDASSCTVQVRECKYLFKTEYYYVSAYNFK